MIPQHSMDPVTEAITELKIMSRELLDGQNDHEKRIRKLESYFWRAVGAIGAGLFILKELKVV